MLTTADKLELISVLSNQQVLLSLFILEKLKKRHERARRKIHGITKEKGRKDSHRLLIQLTGLKKSPMVS